MTLRPWTTRGRRQAGRARHRALMTDLTQTQTTPKRAAGIPGPSKAKLGRKALIAKLDAAFSLWIRLRDKRVGGRCRIGKACKWRGAVEVCYHIIPRGAYSVRWLDANAVGACRACNYGEQFHRLAYREHHIALFGAVYSELQAMSREHAKFSTADLADMLAEIRAKLGADHP